MSFNELRQVQEEVFATFCDKGFNDIPKTDDWTIRNVNLIITEIAEAYECCREKTRPIYYENGKPEGEAIELVDAVIRILNFDKQLIESGFISPLDIADRAVNEIGGLTTPIREHYNHGDRDFRDHLHESRRASRSVRIFDSKQSFYFSMFRLLADDIDLESVLFNIEFYLKDVLKIDMIETIRIKDKYNQSREKLHGKRF